MTRSIRITAALIMVVATGVLTLAPAVGAASTTPFRWVWGGIDSGDGSTQWAAFVPHGKLFYVDESASVCGGAPAFGIGSGVANGPTWTGTFSIFCTNSPTSFPDIPIMFTFHPSDGTLTWTINPADSWVKVGGS
jgi:hypothetical protein